MERRKFRIGELAEHLAVEKFVIRFWEKEFNVQSTRSHGGQRFYTEEDAHMFAAIKDLLYDRGFTIAGARKELPRIVKQKSIPARYDTAVSEQPATPALAPHRDILHSIKKELLILRTLIAQLR